MTATANTEFYVVGKKDDKGHMVYFEIDRINTKSGKFSCNYNFTTSFIKANQYANKGTANLALEKFNKLLAGCKVYKVTLVSHEEC